jgi:uncharacterized membrane protein YkvI
MRSENLTINAAVGGAAASSRLDIRAAAGITGAYVAYMMGSGFSTGQEILQYFACYGMAGLFSILLCMGLLIFAAVSFIRAGYREQFKKPEDVYVYYCGKRLGRAYHYFTTVSIYLCFIVMVAAAGAAVEQYFGISRIIGAIAIGALACATVMLGLNSLVSILGHIGPFMILMVILMGVITICRSNLTAAAETIARIPEMKLLRASPSWVLASVSYVGISVVWLASYLTSIGRRAKSIASASVGAAGGVIAFYIGMLLIYFAIMLNIDELAGAQIPMLILAGRISPVTSGVFSILIVTGIYTASVPLLWQTAFRLAEEGSLRFRRISVLLAALGIAASLLLPFNRLMNIVYVLIGYLGFLLLACMVLKAAKIIK